MTYEKLFELAVMLVAARIQSGKFSGNFRNDTKEAGMDSLTREIAETEIVLRAVWSEGITPIDPPLRFEDEPYVPGAGSVPSR